VKQIYIFLLALSLPSTLSAARGVFRDFPLPSASAEPASVIRFRGETWFTEFEANKIGRISYRGELTEYPIPTPASGPLGIATDFENVWFTEFRANKIGRITPEGVITEFSIPTSASGPYAITGEITDSALWFTEFEGNKLGRITPEGVISEFVIPTPTSGPMGISRGPSGTDILFTESRANKIGWMLREGGIVREIPIPTPDSGPAGITMDSSGRIWFTESNVGRIGRIVRLVANPAIEEFVLPNRDSGPVAIDAGDDGRVWFTERLANKIGRIDVAGRIVEYPIAATASGPFGIVGEGWHVWFAERESGRISRMTRDAIIAVGVGVSGAWDTEFRLANASFETDDVYIGLWPEAQTVCPGSCFNQTGIRLTGSGTATRRASQFLFSLMSLHLRGELEEVPPTATARVFNTARPTQGVEVPLIRLSTLWERNPSVLAFPSARRRADVHSNLVLSEVGWDDDVTVLAEALSADGTSRGSALHRIRPGVTLFLTDILAQLGVPEFDGQIRVTRVSGNGLMWGLLATLSDDGGVTVSPGINP
jgi:virginiamycin B lyase